MPAAARLGDKAQVAADAHGCAACPHPGVGPVVAGSTDVFINKLAAARQGDPGVHAACCGANTFKIAKGSPTVYVNGQPLARMNDKCSHCGGDGPLIEGSPDVMIDDGVPDAAAVAALKAIQIAIKLAEATKVKDREEEKKKHALDSKEEKESAAKGTHSKTVPAHEPQDPKKEKEKKKEEEKKKKEEEEKKEKEKKDKKEKEDKEKKKKADRPDEVEVEIALHDADDPSQPLASAQVEYVAYGEKHVGETDKAGKLKAKLKGKKGGTFELIVKSQGVLPAFTAQPHPAAESDPAPDDNGDEVAEEVTPKQLERIMPGATKENVVKYCEPLNAAMFEYEIRSPRRQAAFIAQLAVESGEFADVEEIGSGAQYNGRADLGNTHPGDGPKYKGRGLIQITGRDNYATLGKALNVNLLDHPERLTETVLACRASAYFFYARRCNEMADRGQFTDICVAVNGKNPKKLVERREFWAAAKRVLGNSDTAEKQKKAEPLEDVEVEIALHDADDPSQPLAGAQVEYVAYGEKHVGETDKAGKLKAKLKGKKGGTFELIVKSQGVLPAFTAQPHPAAESDPAPDDNGDEVAEEVTPKQLERIMPGATKENVVKYCEPLNAAMFEYEIRSPRRQAAFIAQLAVESGEFADVEEIGSGAQYNGRADLGNTHPGDGPKYKGRGLIQITGRDNYATLGKALNVNLLDHPERLTETVLACRASAYFFFSRQCNEMADRGQFTDICVAVNGKDPNKLVERREFWAAAKRLLGNSDTPEVAPTPEPAAPTTPVAPLKPDKPPKPATPPKPAAPPDKTKELRDAIVKWANWMLDHKARILYEEIRPIPQLQAPFTHALPLTTDCSGSVTICYSWAGAPDPNGNGFNGAGDTATLLNHMRHIPASQAKPGDLVVFGDALKDEHVCMLIKDVKATDTSSESLFSHGGPHLRNPPHPASIDDEVNYRKQHGIADNYQWLTIFDD